MHASLWQSAAAIYERSAATTITRHRIEHPSLGKFCTGLNSLFPRLGELASEDYWQKFLIPLKRLQFGLCAAPFPNDYRYERLSIIIEKSEQHLVFCRKLYPDVADYALGVLELLKELCSDPADPLLAKLLAVTSIEQKVAWVIRESRLISHVEESIARFNSPKPNVIHYRQLKSLTCYDQLVILGPSRWFPEAIFTAPRAHQIDILIYDWIRDYWKPKNVFIRPHISSGSPNGHHISLAEHKTSSRWDWVDPDTLLDIVDKASSVSSALVHDKDNSEDEVVEAICVFLEGDWAVFIEANEQAKTLVIDPDEDSDDRIARVLTKEIRSGMFILVRNSGSGDYIVPVADRIMGSQAQSAREYQNHWKKLLRDCIRRNGLLETCIALLDQGSDLANEINVRNWISPRNIRTRNYNDFLAIMRLVGLEDKAQEYWTMMKRINQAHRKAGFEIRDLLLEQVKDLSMEALQKQGKMDFKLFDDDGGLTAYRVESVLPKILEVSYSRTGKPFQLESQLWHV